jgi:hypothetical protein
MKMAYLAVAAHQSFKDLKELSLYELDLFVNHVSLLNEMQNELFEREAEKRRLETDHG